MPSTSPTIMFFGTDQFSVAALHHLIQAGYHVAAVVTKPDARSGRGQKVTPPAVKILAESHDIPVWQPTALKDIIDPIRALGPVTGVLSSFGRIIPQAILDLFTPGILNIHPSLLPTYRGPTPIETAILHGDEQTGVSLIRLTAEMDAGPIYAQIPYPLHGHETQSQLYEELADQGGSLLIQHLPAILDGSLQPRDQVGEVSYSQLLKKQDALPDPADHTAAELANKVRAHLIFPKTKLTLSGQLVTITAAHAAPEPLTPIDVRCKDGQYLVIDELLNQNGRRMDAQSFLNGLPKA